jgi:hypothetical protein
MKAFAVMERAVAEGLWGGDLSQSLYRLVTSWGTTDQTVEDFIKVERSFERTRAQRVISSSEEIYRRRELSLDLGGNDQQETSQTGL